MGSDKHDFRTGLGLRLGSEERSPRVDWTARLALRK